MNELIDKKIGNEIDGSIISDLFNGYIFKITGGYDDDGMAMKNGILTQGRKKILLQKGSKNFRYKNGYHRTGIRKRKLVRGCIVSHSIKVLSLKIVKAGPNQIPGLTDPGCELPSRLGPKRATKILKQFGLVSLYKKKSRDTEERKNLRYLITKYANKRTFTNAKGKEVHKRPKIQRLITPDRLRRKRVNANIKEENRKINDGLMKKYRDTVRSLRKPVVATKKGGKKH